MTMAKADKPAFLSATVRVGGIVDVLIFLALTSSWLGLLGRWHWTLDLMSHFRWQYLVACVVAVLLSLFLRRRMSLAFSLATLALNSWLVGALVLHSSTPTAAARGSLRVISLNLLTTNRNRQKVTDYLRDSNADLIFLMEVDDAWGQAVQALKKAYPYGMTQTREDNFGVLLLSRIPLSEVRTFTLGDEELPSVEAVVNHQQRQMMLIGTHPLPPIGSYYARRRDAHLSQVAARVRELHTPVLLVGDLNATPWSEGLRLLTRDSGLGLAPDSWRPTWQASTLFALPIDHALCSGGLLILSKKIGPDVGSDHRPIELEISWAEPNP
jgi:endonuclease/exonuclease/phosphatase (EEP) superfamily protein YafD